MNRSCFLRWWTRWLVGTLLFGSTVAGAVTQEELENLLGRMDQVMTPCPAEYFIKVVNEVPAKEPEELILYAVYSENRWAGLITAPDHLKGRSIIRNGKQIWVHIPGELESRTGEMQHSFIGGVMDNRVLLRQHDRAHYRPELVQDEEKRLAIDLIPRNPDEGLPRRYMVINKKLNVPESETIFSGAKEPLKEITYLDVKQFGDLPPRPAKIMARSLINTGYVTTLTIGWMHSRSVPDEAFTKSFLTRVGSLLVSSGQ